MKRYTKIREKYLRFIYFKFQELTCCKCDKRLIVNDVQEDNFATVDHFVPKTDLIKKNQCTNDVDNFRLLCRKCNNRKSDKIISYKNKYPLTEEEIKFIENMSLTKAKAKFRFGDDVIKRKKSC